MHSSCILKFLFVKFSRIYFKVIRLRGESLFCRIAVAGPRRVSNISVVLVEEFDLDLTLIFFCGLFFRIRVFDIEGILIKLNFVVGQSGGEWR